MTTLICWVAVDPNGPSALYFASDSRISWGAGREWDVGRKLFAARSHPDIFGYYGEALSPSLLLGQVIEAIDAGYLSPCAEDFDARCAAITSLIKNSIAERRRVPRYDFGIIHATRISESMTADFRIRNMKYQADPNTWTATEIEVPKSKSQLVLALGTGAGSIEVRVRQAASYGQSDTSRSVFWHLCDSIQSGDDPLSGGAPQLVGLYRSFPARTFGIVLDGSRFLNGLRLAGPLTSEVVEWRDKDFQRVDGETMGRLPDAQRHGRTRRR